jgi:shikimate kinase
MIRLQRSVSVTNSAITVVSAFASGKGAAIGIGIPCEVIAELKERKNGDKSSDLKIVGTISDPHKLVHMSAIDSIDYLRVSIPKSHQLVISIDSKIPVAVGLKSSSAVSVAVVKAIFGLYSENQEADRSQEILRLSCKASIRSGASLTGAFDDAAAGFLGGLVFSDNIKFKLLGQENVKKDIGSIVKILVPEREKKLTSSLDLSAYQEYKKMSLEAFRFAVDGVLAQGMLLNSIIHSLVHHYSLRPVVSSISEGATAAGISGKGPAVAAICRNSKTSDRVARRWLEENENCKVITSSVIQPKITKRH